MLFFSFSVFFCFVFELLSCLLSCYRGENSMNKLFHVLTIAKLCLNNIMSRYFNILDDNYIPKTKLKEMLKWMTKTLTLAWISQNLNSNYKDSEWLNLILNFFIEVYIISLNVNNSFLAIRNDKAQVEDCHPAALNPSCGL